MKLKLSEITVLEGRRDIDHVKVSELAESIRIVGLINPITVRKDYTLVAGAHRLEACRLLGFDEIECVVLDCDELLSELAEIDKNFVRNDLDDISIGELAIRRDEILDALGLRVKAEQGNGAKKCREQIVNACGNKCYVCGNGFVHILHVHHLQPINRGGSRELENLIVLCPNCHATVHRIMKYMKYTPKSGRKCPKHIKREKQRAMFNEMLEEHFRKSQIIKLLTLGMRKQNEAP